MYRKEHDGNHSGYNYTNNCTQSFLSRGLAKKRTPIYIDMVFSPYLD